jgi:surface protein
MKKRMLLLGSVLFFLSISFSQESQAYEAIYELGQSVDEKSGLIKIDEPIVPQTKLASRQIFSALPTKFDYTTGNVETKMRSQGGLGICWAYSAADVITTSNKKEFGLEYTLSPNYFNYYSASNAFSDIRNPYGTRELNSGGDTGVALVQSTLGKGIVSEETFNTATSVNQNPSMAIQKFQEIQSQKTPIHIEELAKIQRVSYNGVTKEDQLKKVDAIKRKVYEYGAVSFSYHEAVSHNEKYYNFSKRTSFVPIRDAETSLVPKSDDNWVDTNHAVVIVGWDDQFSRSNFKIAPENDGAFLIKNSWGSGNGTGVGYFYISYEDLYILNSTNYSVDTKMTAYDNRKSYVDDWITHYSNISSASRSIYLGSVFSTGEKKERLQAISFYSEQLGVNYEVYYIDEAIKNYQVMTNKENMKKIASGTLKNSGLKEIATDPIEIEENKEYSIVVQVTYPEDIDSFHLSVQQVRNAKEGKYPDLAEGRTFLSMESSSNLVYWRSSSDGTLFGPSFKGNLYISAYTNDLGLPTIPVTGVTVTPTSKELEVGAKQQLEAAVTPENASNKNIAWHSSNSSVATVSATGEVVAKSEGTATVTVITEDGKKTATSEITVRQPKIDAKGEFGTVPWTWEASTQTLKFYEGAFPATSTSNNIRTNIEDLAALEGKKIKHIVFEKSVDANAESSGLFSYLSELEDIENANLLKTNQVIKMNSMFFVSKNLKRLDISQWDTSKVTSMGFMFSEVNNLLSLDLNNWDTSSVANMDYMFSGASSLKELTINHWNTSNATSMNSMFYKARSLSKLDFNRWDVSKVTSMYDLFSEASNLTELDISNWDTSNVTTMSRMFSGVSSLAKLDISRWNTSKVNNMNYMFNRASNLKELNLSHWNISSVTTMKGMFSETNNLTELIVSQWNTSNVVDMSDLFSRANSLNRVDISQWDTSKVANMSYMFYKAGNLTELNINQWNTSKVTNMYSMFSGAGSLAELDVSQWNTSKVTNMATMFSGAGSLAKLNVSQWNTASVTSMTAMFYEARSLVELNTSQWDTSNVTTMNNMFNGASSLNKVDVSQWDTSSVTNMYSMFYGTRSLTELNVSQWDTSKVTDMEFMFNGASGLTNLDVSQWDTSKVTTMRYMFNKVNRLESLDVSQWDTSRVVNMGSMFKEAHNLVNLNVSSWDISNVTDIEEMFYEARSLEKLDLGQWDTSKVTRMASIFYNAGSLAELNVSKWNTSNVANMSYMFVGTKKLEKLDVSQWDTSNVNSMRSMFYKTNSLKKLDVGQWDTSNVKDMMSMFYEASNLMELDMSQWNTSKVTNMENMFYGTKALDKLILGPNSIVKTANLPEKDTTPYTGRWRLENASPEVVFSSSSDLMNNYDGSRTGSYIREKM